MKNSTYISGEKPQAKLLFTENTHRLKKDWLSVPLETKVCLLRIEGVIDEKFVARIPEHISNFFQGYSMCRIHLEHVEQINSFGVKLMSVFLKLLSQIFRTVEAEKCSICMTDQINLVNELTAHLKISSFFAPYYCHHCNEEVSGLIRVQKHASTIRKLKSPEIVHQTCGRAMEFDADEESYFQQIAKNIENYSVSRPPINKISSSPQKKSSEPPKVSRPSLKPTG
jgi:ABC-type transporter Mla MlaB component